MESASLVAWLGLAVSLVVPMRWPRLALFVVALALLLAVIFVQFGRGYGIAHLANRRRGAALLVAIGPWLGVAVASLGVEWRRRLDHGQSPPDGRFAPAADSSDAARPRGANARRPLSGSAL